MVPLVRENAAGVPCTMQVHEVVSAWNRTEMRCGYWYESEVKHATPSHCLSEVNRLVTVANKFARIEVLSDNTIGILGHSQPPPFIAACTR